MLIHNKQLWATESSPHIWAESVKPPGCSPAAPWAQRAGTGTSPVPPQALPSCFYIHKATVQHLKSSPGCLLRLKRSKRSWIFTVYFKNYVHKALTSSLISLEVLSLVSPCYEAGCGTGTDPTGCWGKPWEVVWISETCFQPLQQLIMTN